VAEVVAYLRDKKDQEQRDAAERAERLQQFALPIDHLRRMPRRQVSRHSSGPHWRAHGSLNAS